MKFALPYDAERRPVSLRRLAAAVLALTLAGCARTAAERQVSALEDVTSWAASARMTTEQWLRQTVPTHFAVESLKSAGDAMDRAVRTLTDPPSVPPPAPTAVVLYDGPRAARAAAEAVRKNDQGAAKSALQRLEEVERTATIAARALQRSADR